MAKVPGYVLYRGPSMLDGSPIMLVATGFNGAANVKTGADLVQTYILRSDISPVEASHTGADAAICGSCPHRGEYKDGLLVSGSRSCYVLIFQGPLVVFRAASRGVYAEMSDAPAGEVSALFAGRKVRLGAYGDPAAVPIAVWHAVLAQAAGQTGYTHAWRQFPEFAGIVMASCDTIADAAAAKMLGFRTFRVAPAEGWNKLPGEVLCPASAEAGKRTTCDKCLACSGNAGKARADIMIPLHGNGGQAAAAVRRGVVSQAA